MARNMDEKQPLLNSENANQVVDLERGGKHITAYLYTE